LGVVVCDYNPSYLGSGRSRITVQGGPRQKYESLSEKQKYKVREDPDFRLQSVLKKGRKGVVVTCFSTIHENFR
jgi:hypothetical protein